MGLTVSGWDNDEDESITRLSRYYYLGIGVGSSPGRLSGGIQPIDVPLYIIVALSSKTRLALFSS
jgi:hypothetical protein